jgi:hypothetical protein
MTIEADIILSIMYIKRALEASIHHKLITTSKIIILYGARQVGKTTLINTLLPQLPYRSLRIDADESKYKDILSSKDVEKLKSLVAGYDLLTIDEAQQIPNIGTTLKLIHDHIPHIKVLVTGSSSFDLADKLSEPLTGRHLSYTLYPISYSELAVEQNQFELTSRLEERLVYGSYPELFSIASSGEKKEYLDTLCTSYLFKDILGMVNVRNSAKLHDLLRLLAFQIGNQVSLTELGTSLMMSKDTVARYIDLLEKSFVLFRLRGLSRNLRKEVSKMDKIYFYDLGIRNSIIDMIKPLNVRNDGGQLWENFLIVERLKHNAYTKRHVSPFFWRLQTGAEVDYVEDRENILHGYEIKWNKKMGKCPPSWKETYPQSTFEVVNKDTYLPFVGGV